MVEDAAAVVVVMVVQGYDAAGCRDACVIGTIGGSSLCKCKAVRGGGGRQNLAGITGNYVNFPEFP